MLTDEIATLDSDVAYEAKEHNLLRKLAAFGIGKPGISIDDTRLLDRPADFPEFTAVERDEEGMPIACREIQIFPSSSLPLRIPNIPQKYLTEGRVFQTYMLVNPARRGKGNWTNLYPIAIDTLRNRISGPGVILNSIDIPDTPKYHVRRTTVHDATIRNGFTLFKTLKGQMYYLPVYPK